MRAEWQAMLIGFLSGGQPIRQRKSKNDRMECLQVGEFGKRLAAFERPSRVLGLALTHLFVFTTLGYCPIGLLLLK
jgi:hypothetical protein